MEFHSLRFPVSLFFIVFLQLHIAGKAFLKILHNFPAARKTVVHFLDIHDNIVSRRTDIRNSGRIIFGNGSNFVQEIRDLLHILFQ